MLSMFVLLVAPENVQMALVDLSFYLGHDKDCPLDMARRERLDQRRKKYGSARTVGVFGSHLV